MNMDNDELIIKNALNAVNTPEYDIASEIDKDRSAKKSPSFKRHLVTATVLLLLLTFTVAAAAATVSGFKYLMAIIGEGNAAVVTPVELSDEDQGIKMEVVAAGRFDNMLKVYLTLQDLKEERIMDNVRIVSAYVTGSLAEKGEGIFSMGCGLINYDKQNEKAIFLYEMRGSRKLDLDGEELTLKINKILYNTREQWDYKVEKDLSETERNPAVYYVSLNQLTELLKVEELDKNGKIPVLKEQEEKIESPQTNMIKISAVGIIDGRLHIQVWRDKNADESLDFEPYLRDTTRLNDTAEGYIHVDSYFSFDIENGTVTGETDNPAYKEYVFNIDENKLDDYELLAFISKSDVINGNWEVKFSSKDSGEILKTQCNLDTGTATIKFAAINPFGGIRIEGTKNKGVPLALDVKINTSQGKIAPPIAGGTGGGISEGKFTVYYEAEKPVDLNSVQSLEINGQTIKFKK